ncbi:response regulator [Sulfurovum sp.]|uniref:response regulator n=1 Tax=Sulfurovum sp. TaxID=1969726 RepID=UPI0025F45097|nr:response regulator [Sulfurovum sp.]
MKNKKTVFIVEDDLLSAEYLKEILIKENYDVLDIVDTAEEAVQKCKTIQPDIVLMDIMLKGRLSGSEAAVEIKHFHPESKIIFLTAYAEPEMVDYAARSQACAYLLKPYREKEILATIRVILTQDHTPLPEKEMNLIPLKNNFVFDSEHRRLYKENKEVPLSSKKLKLIELLAKNKNHTVSNEQICLYVWNEMKSNSTLRSLIHRFRTVINDDIITNVNGVGYSIST